MNKFELDEHFKYCKQKFKLDFAIIETDKYGRCSNCVETALKKEFGDTSSGIYLFHWQIGPFYGDPVDALNEIEIVVININDITLKHVTNYLSRFYSISKKALISDSLIKIAEL